MLSAPSAGLRAVGAGSSRCRSRCQSANWSTSVSDRHRDLAARGFTASAARGESHKEAKLVRRTTQAGHPLDNTRQHLRVRHRDR